MPRIKTILIWTPSLISISSQFRSTPISSRYWCPHRTELIFDVDAKNKSFSTATQKPNQCRSTTMKWSHFRQPTQPNSFNPTLESSHVRSTHKIQVDLHAHTRNKKFSPCVKKTSQFGPPTQQTNQFYPCIEIKSSSIPHTEIKSIWTTHTNTKSIFMLIIKTSDIRPAYE